MSEMQAELAAQRYLLSQPQERDAIPETLNNRKEARKRGFVGGLRWARATDRAILMPVVSAWHMVVESRRTQGLLRARLLEEESCREMALRQQKMELSVQHMEAEQKFREDVLSLRTLLAEAEARCAIALASPLLLQVERLRPASLGTDSTPTDTGATTTGDFLHTSGARFHGSNTTDQQRMAESVDIWSAAGSSPRSGMTVSREESDDEGDAMFADKTI
jgi:hypothetical protein